MYGAILGDIIGEPYEWHNYKAKDFPLFCEDARFTDDSVMTIAICDGILKAGLDADERTMKGAMIKSMHFWGENIPTRAMVDGFANGFSTGRPSRTTAGGTVQRCA